MIGSILLLKSECLSITQYVADYALFRKCWNPEISIDAVLNELAAELGIPLNDRQVFIKAVKELDSWWEDANLDALDNCCSAIEILKTPQTSGFLSDLADLNKVLQVLGHYLSNNHEQIAAYDYFPPKDLVTEIRELMIKSRKFETYTVHQHWEIRSEEIIAQRIRWWMQAIRMEFENKNPARQVGN